MEKNWFNVPNILTFIRLLLVPVYWYAFFNVSVWVAFGIFLIASLTDAVDGYIARKFNLITNLGKVLDPFADKIMQVSAMISVVIGGYLHWIFAVLIFIKEFYMITCGMMLLNKKIVVYSNVFGKLATFIMLAGFLLMFVGIGLIDMGIVAGTVMLVIAQISIAVALVFSYYAAVVYTAKVVSQLRGKKLNGEEKIDIKL